MSYFTLVSFNAIYAWEDSLIDPKAFWEHLPPNWSPHYHFFNVLIDSSPTGLHSPLRFIRDLATEDDFVSLKLGTNLPRIERAIIGIKHRI